ncbi:unnamed protein product [Parajaminaea phylloscopi]
MAPPSAPPPSLLPATTIQHIASTCLSLPSLPNAVASALAADAEHRLHLILQDAEKFMRHARRNKLTCDDVKRALEVKGMEPIYGYLNTPYSRGGQPKLKKAVQAGGSLIYQVENEEIDVDAIASSMSSRYSDPPKSGGVGWKAHWLAVEGVQPLIPENPPPTELTAAQRGVADDEDPYDPAATAALALTGGSSSTSGAVAPAPVSGDKATSTDGSAAAAHAKDSLSVNAQAQPLVKHILSRELQVYYQRLTEAIMHGATPSPATLASNGGPTDPVDAQGDSGMASGTGDASNTPVVSDAISLAALSSLRSDPGLHQLVPYLCQWISTTITAALALPANVGTNSATTRLVIDRMLGSIEAMLLNPHIGIEGYIHLLLPPLLSCILISLPSTVYEPSLRRRGAELLGKNVLGRFGAAYPSLKPRIARVLLEAAFNGVDTVEAAGEENDGDQKGRNRGTGPEGEDEDEDQPRPALGTKLGAILALRACGGGMTRALVRARRPAAQATGTREAVDETDRSPPIDSNPFGCKFSQLGVWVHAKSPGLSMPEAEATPTASRRSKRTMSTSTPSSQMPGTEELNGQAEADLDAGLVVNAVRDCLHDLAAMGAEGAEHGVRSDGESGQDSALLRRQIGGFWADQFSLDETAKAGVRFALNESSQPQL